MSIISTIKVFQDAEMTAQDFALTMEKITPKTSGIIYGCTPTMKNSTTVHVSSGWVVLRGRIVRIEEGDATVSLPSSGTITRYLVAKVDLANVDEPSSVTVAASVGTDSNNFNIVSGQAYLSLGTITIGTTSIMEVTGVTPMGSVSEVVEQAKTEIDQKISEGFGAKSITIPTTGWSGATTVDGSTYYTYTTTLTAVSDPHPSVLLGATGTLPTDAQKEAFGLVKYITVNTSNKELKLYAEAVPTTSFVIIVKGVA